MIMKNIVYFNYYDNKIFSSWVQTSKNIYDTVKHEYPDTDCLESLTLSYKFVSKIKNRFYKQCIHQIYLKERYLPFLKSMSKQLTRKLSNYSYHILLSPTTLPISYINLDQDIITWTDSTFPAMLNFYPGLTNVCSESIENAMLTERLALEKTKLAIYTSKWAADAVIQNYNIDKNKIHVIPYGPNLDHDFTYDQIREIVRSRSKKKCRLLFIGTEWYRKGGDTVIETLKELNRRKFPAELVIIGPFNKSLSDVTENVIFTGFLDKNHTTELDILKELVSSSHFFIMPSRAECTGIVFSEANYFAVPALGSDVGGIPTIIKNDINGRMFNVDCRVQEYADYIMNMFSNYKNYVDLALSSYNECVNNLTWDISGKKLKKLIDEM